jgi:lysozyme
VTPSKTCAEFIKSYEQCRLKAYMPTPNDVPTIGWGSTGSDVKLGMTWTQEQADSRFARDLADFAGSVARNIDPSKTTQKQFDAMVSLAYNIGQAAFKNSTLLRKHQAGDFAGAQAQFGRWNKQAGKVLNGLTRRRAAEAAMYGG